MRKIIIKSSNQTPEKLNGHNWLNIENIAAVEVTSEHEQYPIESALLFDSTSGWIAGEEGIQTIRLVFDDPQTIQRILLKFSEASVERTQEYVLNWYAEDGKPHQIVRQQWNFNPNGSTREEEDHRVNLAKVTVLELCINPNISNSKSIASLEKLSIFAIAQNG